MLFYLVTSIDVADNWIFAVALNPGTNDPNIIHTYGGAGTTFDATSFRCCRISGLRNPTAGYGVQTRVTLGTGNRSPVSNIVPIVTVGSGGVQSWFVPAADADADPLSWRLSTILEATGPGFGGGTQPPGLTIDASSGQVSWNTTGLPLGQYWTQKTIEELNPDGTIKGSVAIDYLINVVVIPPDNKTPDFPPPPPNTPPTCGATVPAFVGNTVSFTVSASDADAGNTVSLIVTGLPPGATSPIPPAGNPVSSTFNWTPTAGQVGPHVITYAAIDNFGAQGLCPVTVNVVANQPPEADAGSDDTLEWEQGLTADLDGSGSSDPDGDALTFEWTDSDNDVVGTTAQVTVSLNGLGDHTFTLTVTDPSGESDSDDVTITAEDTTAPTINLSVNPSELWPPNHMYVTIDLSALVTDACDDNPSIEVWVESDQPDNAIGIGDGNTTGDIRVTLSDASVLLSSDPDFSVHFDLSDLEELELRAEEAGTSPGRTYTITVMATDGSGNESQESVTVTVPHDRRR